MKRIFINLLSTLILCSIGYHSALADNVSKVKQFDNDNIIVYYDSTLSEKSISPGYKELIYYRKNGVKVHSWKAKFDGVKGIMIPYNIFSSPKNTYSYKDGDYFILPELSNRHFYISSILTAVLKGILTSGSNAYITIKAHGGVKKEGSNLLYNNDRYYSSNKNHDTAAHLKLDILESGLNQRLDERFNNLNFREMILRFHEVTYLEFYALKSRESHLKPSYSISNYNFYPSFDNPDKYLSYLDTSTTGKEKYQDDPQRESVYITTDSDKKSEIALCVYDTLSKVNSCGSYYSSDSNDSIIQSVDIDSLTAQEHLNFDERIKSGNQTMWTYGQHAWVVSLTATDKKINAAKIQAHTFSFTLSQPCGGHIFKLDPSTMTKLQTRFIYECYERTAFIGMIQYDYWKKDGVTFNDYHDVSFHANNMRVQASSYTLTEKEQTDALAVILAKSWYHFATSWAAIPFNVYYDFNDDYGVNHKGEKQLDV
jgi:hypothetical protein